MKLHTINILKLRPALAFWLLCLIAFPCSTNWLASASAGQQASWKAGAASIVITPDESMWMAGYAARNKPSEGKVHDLHAKALALEDEHGTRLVIVTADLIGIPRPTRDWLTEHSKESYNLEPEALLLNASHTHSGPVVRETRYSIYGNTLYGLSPEQIQQSNKYVDDLQDKLLELIGRAIENLAPAKLSYTHARAGFAMNRRLKTETGVQNSPNPDGPVDHDVPVLRIDSPEGKLQAVLFGYACHNTTLSGYEFCGDYAGFAQQYIQETHPEATALFMAGCGGDQNPYPRGGPNTLDYCKQHGRALANGVEVALTVKARPVVGPVQAGLDTVTLEFAEVPTKEQLEQQAKSTDKYERRHAEVLLEEIKQNGAIRTTYPYLVQVIRFGDDLTMVALAGEVVVDYSLRLKSELPGAAVWVAGYSNDVFGYIPSARVLTEGGYEAGDAMRYTDLPGPFAKSVEERIVARVHELAMCPHPESKLDLIRPSDDGSGFIRSESGAKFLAWGFNYDHDDPGRLLEDYWHEEWPTVVEDFKEIKTLGANTVRIHLQAAKFMQTPTEPNKASLEQLARLVELAEQTRLYLDITGLGCYHKKDVPDWYDAMDEAARWDVQARFWEAVAKICAESPAIFCYDLMNEPILPGADKVETEWLAGEFGGKFFVQRITLDLAGRTREQVARAWVDNLVTAIRKHDNKHMITVGVIPWALVWPNAKPFFYSKEIGENLDFASVHFYPKKGEVEKALKALAVYNVGKPLVVEEMFPLSCGTEELDAFIEGSRNIADGWISFYWGKSIEDYARGDPDITGAIIKDWLEHFRAKGPAILRQKQ